MQNKYQITLTLTELDGAIVREMGGVEYVCIPATANGMFINHKKQAFLGLNMTPLKREGKNGETHFLKTPKKKTMSFDDYYKLPFIGNAKPKEEYSEKQGGYNAPAQGEQGKQEGKQEDDLPF